MCEEESDHGLFSFRALYEAYLACRKRKRNTANALKFEADQIENLRELSETLADGSYRPSRSVCFVTSVPKLREIFAADFRDRVVHHLLVPRLEKIYEPKFIYDSYACRVDKGTHAAVERLQSFMNKITRNGHRPAWFMQLDVRSFFMSIDRELLYGIIKRQVADPVVLALAKLIIDNDCTAGYVYKGDRGLLGRIPPHKSLFHVAAGKGLPIGNLTSQFFANVYLNELDQFVKHELKCRYYLRYVDDFILLDESADELLQLQEAIAAFLAARLQLELKAGLILKRVSEGADFLGYIVRPDYILVRNRVVGNLKANLRYFQEKMVVKAAVGRDWYRAVHLHEDIVRDLRQTFASYLGHFSHANAYNLIGGLWENNTWLGDVFALDRRDGLRLEPCYEPPEPPVCLKDQYLWAVKAFGGYCIFFQIGRFFEFFGRQAMMAGRVFGCAIGEDRRGLGKQCGFPVRMIKRFKERARHRRWPYVVIAENGYYAKGLKRRVVTEKLTFCGGMA